MNTNDGLIRWHDLAQVAERNPGLLREVANLRRSIEEYGGLTLAQLLEWQVHPDRHTQLGVVPVNVNTVDLLDKALTDARDIAIRLNARLREESEARADAEARANMVDREELSNAREKLRDAFDALRGLLRKVDPDGDDFMNSEF